LESCIKYKLGRSMFDETIFESEVHRLRLLGFLWIRCFLVTMRCINLHFTLHYCLETIGLVVYQT